MSDHMFIGNGSRADQEVTLRMRDLYLLFKTAAYYKIRDNVDIDAAAQDFCCHIEKHLGIFPNVPRLEGTTDD